MIFLQISLAFSMYYAIYFEHLDNAALETGIYEIEVENKQLFADFQNETKLQEISKNSYVNFCQESDFCPDLMQDRWVKGSYRTVSYNTNGCSADTVTADTAIAYLLDYYYRLMYFPSDPEQISHMHVARCNEFDSFDPTQSHQPEVQGSHCGRRGTPPVGHPITSFFSLSLHPPPALSCVKKPLENPTEITCPTTCDDSDEEGSLEQMIGKHIFIPHLGFLRNRTVEELKEHIINFGPVIIQGSVKDPDSLKLPSSFDSDGIYVGGQSYLSFAYSQKNMNDDFNFTHLDIKMTSNLSVPNTEINSTTRWFVVVGWKTFTYISDESPGEMKMSEAWLVRNYYGDVRGATVGASTGLRGYFYTWIRDDEKKRASDPVLIVPTGYRTVEVACENDEVIERRNRNFADDRKQYKRTNSGCDAGNTAITKEEPLFDAYFLFGKKSVVGLLEDAKKEGLTEKNVDEELVLRTWSFDPITKMLDKWRKVQEKEMEAYHTWTKPMANDSSFSIYPLETLQSNAQLNATYGMDREGRRLSRYSNNEELHMIADSMALAYILQQNNPASTDVLSLTGSAACIPELGDGAGVATRGASHYESDRAGRGLFPAGISGTGFVTQDCISEDSRDDNCPTTKKCTAAGKESSNIAFKGSKLFPVFATRLEEQELKEMIVKYGAIVAYFHLNRSDFEQYTRNDHSIGDVYTPFSGEEEKRELVPFLVLGWGTTQGRTYGSNGAKNNRGMERRHLDKSSDSARKSYHFTQADSFSSDSFSFTQERSNGNGDYWIVKSPILVGNGASSSTAGKNYLGHLMNVAIGKAYGTDAAHNAYFFAAPKGSSVRSGAIKQTPMRVMSVCAIVSVLLLSLLRLA
ncbi:uncharacterized protein MONOS_13769 [Monocercomonoides exilis]|uniref:uncharacterized protein n=1 Tax=Monocercomonoides exilis TaxID=2049356 RepID=UPI003559552E|nr:hypothetical protein MONOS_13769 [Monocercomonoides exilis]|eukprot:MONOS_13769.1-p1 / transcript=MONOS_13769.1 / gene=MONOS_13769 / organism=Monocercomonoides_exilis_PA203 / gene_product=unspecified product / transcript_product=unspecified product / location=Mono_scaffold00880:1390-3969(-) / protein_length=860 / sequence_SO=supercontig / SO=protein_coding / is_pseudo=false